jgi:glycosyltransferase involved in cell wall biosynthesis
MKIGIITYYLDVGGVEKYIELLSDIFIKKGYQVHIIETIRIGSQSKAFTQKGFKVKSITIHPFESKNHYATRLSETLKQYDLLILNNVYFVHYLLGLLKEEAIVLPVLHNNTQESFHNIVYNHTQWDKLICVSHALEKKFHTIEEIKDKVLTIPTGVLVEENYPKQATKDTPLKILFVGRVEEESKGVLLLPEIVKNVLKSYPNTIHLTVIGEGPSLTLLQERIKELKLNNFFSILGVKKHSEVIKEMRKSHLLLMPSYHEGQGLVYLEAMAQGLIPLVSKLKNNTDLVIKHKKNGLLAPIGDIDAFSKEIIYLLEHPEKISSISYQAWETAKEQLSQKVMEEKYLTLIEEIKKDKPSKRTHKMEEIPYGNIPFFLFRSIQMIKNIIKRIRSKYNGS